MFKEIDGDGDMERKYKCLRYYTLSDDNGYFMRHVMLRDMFNIMDIRNNQMNVLRQNKPIEEWEQVEYFRNNVEMDKLRDEPNDILFSFLHKGTFIGYGGLVHINWHNKRAEVSFLSDPQRIDKRLYEKDFSSFLSFIKQIAFEDLKLNKIWTETFLFRKQHVEILWKNGFLEEGILEQHNYKEPDGFIDSYIHGCLRSDYNGSKE